MIFPSFLNVFGDTTYRGDCPLESADQATLVNQVRKRHPKTAGRLIVHVKNEGKRTARQAQMDKAQGLTKGASDIMIPGNPSLVLELKRKDHTKSAWSEGQKEYLEAAKEAGAFVCVALGWEAALKAVDKWIELNYS